MTDVKEEKLEEPKDLKSRTAVTSKEKIRQLREIVKPPGKKGTWLKFLNDRQLAEVYQRLRMGQSAHFIVRICQNEWKLMRNSTIDSMARAMVDFRKKVFPEVQNWGKKKTKQQKQQSKQFRTMLKKAREKLDPRDGLSWLAWVQLERVHVLHEYEKETGVPIKETDRASKECRETLKVIAEIDMKTGGIETKPEQLDILVNQRFEGMMKVIESGPGGSLAMQQATLKLMEGLKEDVFTLKQNKDGSYSRVEDDKPGDGDTGEGDPEGGADSKE